MLFALPLLLLLQIEERLLDRQHASMGAVEGRMSRARPGEHIAHRTHHMLQEMLGAHRPRHSGELDVLPLTCER